MKIRTVILFIVLLISIGLLSYQRLNNVYDDALKQYNELIYSSQSESGYSISNANKNVNLDEDTENIILSMRPGEMFTGYVAVKNHEKYSDTFAVRPELFALEDDKIDEESEEEGELETIDRNAEVDLEDPYIDIDVEYFDLGPKDWGVIEYFIYVPDETSFGDYNGKIMFYPKSQEVGNWGVAVIKAVALNVYLEVTDNPEVYEYQPISDPQKLAKDAVFVELKKIVAIVFSFICVIFIYYAFTVKNEKK